MKDELLDARNRFYEAWCRCNRLYEELAKMNGLTLNEVLVLFSLFDAESGCTQKQITEKWVIPKQTVNMVLKKFEASGFISQKEEMEDKRYKCLSLTEKGREFAANVVSQYEMIELRALEKVGVRKAGTMNDALERFNHFLEEYLSGYHKPEEAK